MSEKTKDNPPGFTEEILHDAGHICLIFDDEEERRSIVSRFLSAGLQRGELVRYLTDRTEPDEIKTWLLDMGVELPDEKNTGTFKIMTADRFYFPDGRFDPARMIDGMIPHYEEARKAGYHGIRSTGEMSWALKGFPGSDRLLEYESMLSSIKSTFPHFGMCQYDARLFDGATLFKVLQVHPFMVARGQIIRNPYYLKPEEFAWWDRPSIG